jgi:hypothetical protein
MSHCKQKAGARLYYPGEGKMMMYRKIVLYTVTVLW